MGRFYSIPGMSPSGGEGEMSRFSRQGEEVPLEKLHARYPEFYKSRPEYPRSFAEVGDRFKFHGDEAKVLHQESNRDGSIDVTVQRSVRGNSGTYLLKATPDKNRKLVVSDVKRTFE